SSFKNGFFDRSILWIEAVLPDGTITRASRTRNFELLEGMVGSLGTLGIATLLQIKLVPAMKWVELKYIPVRHVSDAMDTLDRLAQDPTSDFLEALIYGPGTPSYGVVTVGKLSAASHDPQAMFSTPDSEWFYEHALRAGESTESILITSYLFRHDRGSFSLGQYCFGRVPLNNWSRWGADSALRSHALAQTMQALHWDDHLFVQDLIVPSDSTLKMLEYLDSNLKIYPLLLPPVLMRPNQTQSNIAVNISLRGWTPSTINNPTAFKKTHRQIEQLLHQLGGFKWLYSHNYFTEDEFWETYPRKQYEQLRVKYHAKYLQNVWEKSETSERKPVSPKPKSLGSGVCEDRSGGYEPRAGPCVIEAQVDVDSVRSIALIGSDKIIYAGEC
ncbi:hypothetical protein P171DRAFT_360946, partial [Karstenula rhodostoma CBS 690.94]